MLLERCGLVKLVFIYFDRGDLPVFTGESWKSQDTDQPIKWQRGKEKNNTIETGKGINGGKKNHPNLSVVAVKVKQNFVTFRKVMEQQHSFAIV